MASPPERRRAARHQQPLADDETDVTRLGPAATRKRRISVDVIIETALGIVESEGYAALTMRRVATALQTGPASLYAHVVNKEDLDELLMGRLCTEIELPEPDPRTWREQIIDVCGQIRDQYVRYPGISFASLAAVPTDLEILRVSEGMLGIVLAGGLDPQTAAWTVDALILYVNAFCLETALRDRHVDQKGSVVGRDALLSRFAALPDSYPHIKRHAAALTSGTALDRFGFTLNVILDGIGQRG
jgi:AcrR family transcriptional regulator